MTLSLPESLSRCTSFRDNVISISVLGEGSAVLENKILKLQVKHLQATHRGGGRSLFRKIMHLNFTFQMEGELSLQAVNTSHIFYLRMGMVPTSFRQEDFIESLLRCLEKIRVEGERVETYEIGTVSMKMSDEGKERWKRAIEEGAPFEQFRDFAQLKPFTTPVQWTRIQEILP